MIHRDQLPFFTRIDTRWNDNDMLGHINNVVYYSYFEATILRFLDRGGLTDWQKSDVAAFAVENLCRFHKPLSYPEIIDAGLAVEHIGTSSVRYRIALFRQGDTTPAADGHWVHVFVDKTDERPTPIPAVIRRHFEAHALSPR